jgi:putative transcriptional regulator
MIELKNNLKEIRLSKELSQEELAEKVSVSRQTIISIEKSIYQPSITLSLKLARVLKVKIEDIFYL